MAAFNFYNPAPVFLDVLGINLAANGTLTFYDQGTTNPRDTWSNSTLTTLNPNPVPLDAAARSANRIFLDGAYTVLLKDNLGATIWTRDVIPGGTAGTTIPALEAGEFLTNDGVNLLWQPIRQMPDPTGSTGQVPTTNGSGYTLQNLPDPPDPDIVVTANSFRAGISSDTTKFFLQTGTGSYPATGTQSSNASVTFVTTFTTVTYVGTQMEAGTMYLHSRVDSKSATGFTCSADSNIIGENIVSAQPFTWVAIGTKTVV